MSAPAITLCRDAPANRGISLPRVDCALGFRAGRQERRSNYTSVLDCYVSSGPDAGHHYITHGTGWVFTATAGDKYTCTFTNTRGSN
jgi:hypothetical protein